MTTATKPPAKTNDEPATIDRKIIEFTPFGTDDKIRLSVEIVKRLVCVPTRSGAICSTDEAIKFMMMCDARKLNPFEGDAFLIGYDTQTGPKFSLITAHQAFLKRAEVHPEFDGMDSGVIVMREGQILDLVGDFHMPTDKVLGGWATVFFKGRSHPMKRRLRASRFNKGFGVWKEDEAGMICKCAEADALRSSFPTQLGGLYTREEQGAEIEIGKPTFDVEATTVTSEAPQPTPAPTGTAAPAPTPEPPPAATQPATPPPKEEPKKKATSSDASDSRSQSTSTPKRTLSKKTTLPSEKRQPNHEKLMTRLAVGGFGASDLMSLAIDNGWVEPSESTFEKLSEDKCAEFLQDENWELIQTLLQEKKVAAAS